MPKMTTARTILVMVVSYVLTATVLLAHSLAVGSPPFA